MNSQFELIKSSGGIDEYRLKSNDLRVLMLQDLSTPVATFMVTYHVGSRNEAIGYTGSTHLLEHLMFKGSRNYNKENGTAIWDELQSIGAQINATTWNDRTNYFEVVPSEDARALVGYLMTLKKDQPLPPWLLEPNEVGEENAAEGGNQTKEG